MINWENYSAANGSPTWNSSEQKPLNPGEEQQKRRSLFFDHQLASNLFGQYPKFLSDIVTSGWGVPCQQPSLPNQSSALPKAQLSDLHSLMDKRPSPFNPLPQIRTDEENFDMLYAEIRETLNSKSATVTEIVDPLIRKGKIGVQILAKAYTEKIPESAKQIPEAIATWILNALDNVKDVKNLLTIINALETLSSTDLKFVGEIFRHMKIDENLQKVAHLLAEIFTSRAAKLLSILPPATQAKLLLQMDCINASGILCKLCDGNQMHDNPKAVGTKNAVEVLVKMGIHNAAITLTQIMSMNQLLYAVIIFAEMPLQLHAKEAADILAKVDLQVTRTLLSQMCIYGYAAGAAEIVESMDIKIVPTILAAIALFDSTNNVVVILRMINSVVMVNIFRDLTRNWHEVAMKTLIVMDSKMMGNMLLVIEKAQNKPVEILKIFNQLPQENAISVFKTMCNFEGRGKQFAAIILATVMKQDMATKVLAALAIKSAAKILKLMYENQLYQPGVLAILPSLAQCVNGSKILGIIGSKPVVNIVLLTCKNKAYDDAATIILKNESILEKKCLMPYKSKIRIEMDKIKAHDAVNKKDKTE
ncbi:MAG: hypothetical protein LBI69_00985 [Puniceicoccales bacterium]|jgi:hypothetical protein|nr:hypothetical protein [Puniceicoccales bacterium]